MARSTGSRLDFGAECPQRLPMRILAMMATVILALATWVSASPALADTNGWQFQREAERAFLIPGLGELFVPQGLSYDESIDAFLVSGYTLDGSADPIFLVDRATGEEIKVVYLLHEDGGLQTGHAGGILVHGSYVYLAGSTDGCLYVYSHRAVIESPYGARIECLGTVPIGTPGEATDDGIRVSWVSTMDDMLVVGEFNFNYLPFFRVSDEPAYEGSQGTQFRARAAVYEFSDEGDSVFGVASEPIAYYYLPDKVQGFVARDGIAYLSTSRFLGRGRILAYDLSATEAVGEVSIAGLTAPAYALGPQALINEAITIPMSEEIDIADGRLYILGESASNLYLVGALIGGQWCYSVDLEFLQP